MCEKDCFNDSDEIFNLYSFKNVTQTYKNQLKKLLSNNVNSPEKLLKDENKNDDREEYDIEKLNIDLFGNNAFQSKNSSIKSEEIAEETEEEIAIVEMVSAPQEGLRRSNRLRNKKVVDSNNTTNEVVSSLPNRSNISERSNKTKKQKKKKRKKILEPEEITLDDSLESSMNLEEEINPEMSVKVIWKSLTIKKFLIRKFQKLSQIYKELSKEESLPVDKIILTLKNVKVNQNDTPASLNLQVFDFLEGGILSESTSQANINFLENIQPQKDLLMLQFQDSNKKIIKLGVNQSEKMKIAMIKYSEQSEIELKNIKFFFDGESINPSSTPTSLGLENNDIIDIVICNDLHK